MTAANGTANHAADRVKVLEREVARVTAQRDDLAADVEALCMQQGSESIFASSSIVLTERILATQKELNSIRVQVRSCENLAMPVVSGLRCHCSRPH